MENLPNCPKCNSSYTYEDGNLYVCPECAYEWNDEAKEENVIKDANGNILNDGDSVIVIKDLKVSANEIAKQNPTIYLTNDQLIVYKK